MKKTKKPVKRKLNIKKVWAVFSPFIKQILEAIYGNKCCTCHRKELTGQNRQLGHFRPQGACPKLRWYILNTGIQCGYCNGPGLGEQYKFAEWIKRVHGEEVLEEILFLSHQPNVTVSQYDYQQILDKIEHYKTKLKNKSMTEREVYKDLIKNKYWIF